MKKESFLKGLVAIGVGTLINLLIGFITTPIITRIVNPIEYGQFSIFTMYTSLALMTLCMGMDQSLLRFYYANIDKSYRKNLVLKCAGIPILFSLFSLSLVLLLLYYDVFSFEFSFGITIILVLNIFSSVIFRFGMLIIRLNHNSGLYARVQVLNKLSYIILVLLFLMISHLDGIYSLTIALVLSVVICTVVALISQKEYLPHSNEQIAIYKSDIKTLIRYGLPFVPSMGITAIFQSLDKLSLNYYRSYSEVGIYASAMTLTALFSIVQSAFNTVWSPRAVEHYEHNPNDIDYYKKAFDMITLVMFSIGIGLIMFKDIFVLLLGEKYREASYIMPFLIFQPIMYTISETTVTGITVTLKSSLHVYVALGACLTNFFGNMLMVPLLGCRGAALSTGISYIVFFVLRTILSEQNYKVGYDLKKISIISIFVAGYATYNTFFEFDIMSAILATLGYLLLFILYKRNILDIYQKCLTVFGGM